jgi:hypothetical protein
MNDELDNSDEPLMGLYWHKEGGTDHGHFWRTLLPWRILDSMTHAGLAASLTPH